MLGDGNEIQENLGKTGVLAGVPTQPLKCMQMNAGLYHRHTNECMNFKQLLELVPATFIVRVGSSDPDCRSQCGH